MATPNYSIGILDPAAVDLFGRTVSETFPANVYEPSKFARDLGVDYFDSIGKNHIFFSPVGTDAEQFQLAGVPASGLLTGQDCCKTQEEVDLFGGFTRQLRGQRPQLRRRLRRQPVPLVRQPQQQRPDRVHLHVEGVRRHDGANGLQHQRRVGGRDRPQTEGDAGRGRAAPFGRTARAIRGAGRVLARRPTSTLEVRDRSKLTGLEPVVIGRIFHGEFTRATGSPGHAPGSGCCAWERSRANERTRSGRVTVDIELAPCGQIVAVAGDLRRDAQLVAGRLWAGRAVQFVGSRYLACGRNPRLCEAPNMAITRFWRGWTKPENADDYERFLLDRAVPGDARNRGLRRCRRPPTR